jgi:hypothetical protein
MQKAAIERVHDYAVSICKAARVFNLEQIGRHPELSWRTQPRKRAGEALYSFRSEFEVLPTIYGKPFIWRFSERGKHLYNVDYMRVHPASKKIVHWLTIGDLWQAMTHSGGRPTVFITEPKNSCEFDVFTIWQNRPLLIEIQRSRLSPKQWMVKWNKRKKWYSEHGYEKAPWQTDKTINPRPVLVCTEGVKPFGMPEYVQSFSSIEMFVKNFAGYTKNL